MRKFIIFPALALLLFISWSFSVKSDDAEWVSLFDGKSLNGWKVGKNASSFKVVKGAIVVNGPTAHLFYVGDFNNHEFKNFEYKVDVMTKPGSNSGIYFHTEYQEEGWPQKGFEVQVNNSHSDWKRTGGLYDILDIKEQYAKDNVWFTEHIIVQGKRIIVKVDDKIVLDYTEPDDFKPSEDHPGRKIASGTFAFQAHDPKSKVYFKNVMVKLLAD